MSTKIQIIDGLLNLKEAAQLNDKLRFYEIFEHYYGVSEEPIASLSVARPIIL